MRPFRFGVQCSVTPSMATWRDLARKSESLGYSCLFIPDHFGNQFGPLVALTVAAEATSTMRVGSLVFDNDYRHPVVLAKEIATLDLASEGRLEFGIGAGWMKSDYDESGMAYDEAAVRVERMVEGLEIMRRLWASEKVSYEGKHYTITEAQGLPRPFSSPHPPIVIGGGSKRILTIAGREADIVGVNPDLRAGYVGREVTAGVVTEKWDERVSWVRDGAGDRFDSLDLQILTVSVMVVPNREETIAQAAPLFGLPAEVLSEIPLAVVGTVDERCDQLVARRERWGLNYVVVHEGELEAFAPVVERLRGA